jgi:protein gp37
MDRGDGVSDIRDQCRDSKVAFFFKQWGGVFKSRTGRELEGRTWNQMPDERRSSWTLRPVEQRA